MFGWCCYYCLLPSAAHIVDGSVSSGRTVHSAVVPGRMESTAPATAAVGCGIVDCSIGPGQTVRSAVVVGLHGIERPALAQ